MFTRRPSVVHSVVLPVLLLLGLATAARATPPVLLSAVSRMAHGAGGSFDVQLPLTGGSGIECRSVANGTTLVLTFNQPVKTATFAVTAGTATLGTPKYDTNSVSVPLTGLIDAQSVTVNVTNAANAAGEILATQDVTLRTLYGDVNGNGQLTGADFSLVRAAVAAGNAVNGATFRCDVNVNGSFSGSDVTSERVAVANGAAVDGGPTNNAIPTISTLATQTVATGTSMTPAGFTVDDAESDPATLTVTATSSDQITIPNGNITVSGTGASRQVTLTPAAGVTSTVPVTVTLYASDGLAYSAPMAFTVNVTPPPITYLATLKPIDGTGSLGSGTALITVSGDRTLAMLAYSYSNLSSADTDDTVNDGSGGVMYDVPVGKARGDQQADGAFKWVFATAKAPDILAALASNTSTFLIESANHPAGELTGTFKPLSGSQAFTPPDAPPSITINPPTPADASRFLQQAGFGGTAAEVAALSNPAAANASTALNDWLTAQFAQPGPIYPNYSVIKAYPPASGPLAAQSDTQPYTASSMVWQIWNRICNAQSPNAYGDSISTDRVHETWWGNAVVAPDALRQRVATALSEILVVSEIEGTVGSSTNVIGLASYYDTLANDAFGNYRQLLSDVTLHPIMGQYLNMRGSTKTSPNENYCREIMQLFSVGLYMLQPDGTLMLDSTGKPIPTYTQAQITSMAQVFTGWNTVSTANALTVPTLIAPVAPATTPTVSNVVTYYAAPMALTAGNHSTGAKTLLSYPGVATIAPATTPATINANTSQTAATAAKELNDTLDNIFNHPNVGPFVCKQLIQRLVTSNPSPGYVYRVAQKFNNNGSGVRGDMKAVLIAILTDYEARSPDVRTNAGYGHMREPIVRFASILHALQATSKTGKWAFGPSTNTLAQTIFRSPTVFNFFDPAYSAPGAVEAAGLDSPEFGIIYETTITNAANMIYTGVYANYSADGTPLLTGTGFRGDSYGSDIYLNFAGSGNGLVALNTASGSSAMLDRVVLLLCGGPLTPSAASNSADPAFTRILQFVNTLSSTDHIGRVKAAVHLVATSAQCAAQK